MTRIKQLLTMALLLAVATTMSAQDKLFTLEDLNFGGTNYRRMLPKNMWLTWWGEQLMYQDAEEGGSIDAKGNRKVLFTLKEVNKITVDNGITFHSAMNASYPYPDQSLVLLDNGTERVLYDFKKKSVAWRQDSKGQLYADWNKVSRAVAYVSDDQLYVTDGQGQTCHISDDGSREIVYGQSVHRNEFGIEKGTFWSPDGQRLAFYRMDQSMVTDYPQVNIFPRTATYEPDKYPMAGMTSHEVTVGVYDTATHKTIYLKTPSSEGTREACYFTNIAWSPDAKTIYMFELNRAQNDCRLVAYNAVTGERLGELYREVSDKYVEPLHPISFLPWDNTKFVMQSQKDGYNHLYLFDTKGRELKQLTAGPWVVTDVLGFNQKGKSIIYISNEKDPLQRNIYSVNVANGKRTLLDKGIGAVQSAQLSAAGEQVVDKYSAPDIPRNIEVIATAKGKGYQLLAAEDPWKGYQQPLFECGSIKAADGVTDLYYRMVKPADFDPAKKYPTVVYVYGGPHAHNVEASWHWYSRSWETYMAQKGYVLFILDNRGSEDRGRDFEQATFHRLGQVEMQDQMKGVEFLKSLPYVDADRLGVHGWSYGGFMTISLMTHYPDVFKVGVAGGPVIDWKWYEVMYGERYMGTPESNPEGYATCSLIPQAKNLKGKLQIIVGYNDPTVVPQHALSFLDACVKAGTQPDFFAYPGEEHNMRGHASVHLHERITQYFENYLK